MIIVLIFQSYLFHVANNKGRKAHWFYELIKKRHLILVSLNQLMANFGFHNLEFLNSTSMPVFKLSKAQPQFEVAFLRDILTLKKTKSYDILGL